MKRKAIWLVMSFLTCLSLLLASCAPSAPTPTATTTAPTPAPATTAPTTAPATVAPSTDKPKYGGTLILGVFNEDITLSFDQFTAGSSAWLVPMTIMYDELLTGDWAMGPAGTNKVKFSDTNFQPEGVLQETGSLAESWTIPDDQTFKFKIRKGVRWWDKPPVNGRELTPEDIVYGLKRMYMLLPEIPPGTRPTQNVSSAQGGNKMTDVFIDPNDPRTVVVKVTGLAGILLQDISDKTWMVPKENVKQKGDLTDWKNALGTGPFMLTDYVPGSSLTLVRNSNYWKTNPVGPGKGDQLPYLDGLKFLVIQDAAAQNAALRTAKVDHLMSIGWEDAQGFQKTTTQLLQKRQGTSPTLIRAHTETTDPLGTPLLNQKVRWALSMAIDRATIQKDYFGGFASYYEWLAYENTALYIEPKDVPGILEKQGFKPEDAKMGQQIIEYHPDIAKKLLTEAGYPNGFKTTIIIGDREEDPDYAAIIKDFWLRNLNVDLALDIRTRAVYKSVTDSRAFPALVFRSGSMAGWAERFNYWGPSAYEGPRSTSNITNFRDKKASEMMQAIETNFADAAKSTELLRDYSAYLLWTGWYIPIPAPYAYAVWWPWLKNYHGENAVGYRNVYNWVQYAWYDKDLKKTMGY